MKMITKQKKSRFKVFIKFGYFYWKQITIKIKVRDKKSIKLEDKVRKIIRKKQGYMQSRCFRLETA